MNLIKKWIKRKKRYEEEKKERQSKCKHEWVKIPLELKINNYSLLGLITGATKVYIKTEGYICRKCDKETQVQVNIN